MGFGDAYTQLRCDQGDGKEEKDVQFLLDKGKCFHSEDSLLDIVTAREINP